MVVVEIEALRSQTIYHHPRNLRGIRALLRAKTSGLTYCLFHYNHDSGNFFFVGGGSREDISSFLFLFSLEVKQAEQHLFYVLEENIN